MIRDPMSDLMPSDTFRWKQEPWGRALECVPLAAVATHLFSTRDLNGTAGPGTSQAPWDALAASLGVPADRIARVRQVHGRAVFRAAHAADRRTEVLRHEEAHDQASGEPPAADAIVGTDRASALAVRVADCVSVLIADRRTGAAAAIHAGWRGTGASLCTAVVLDLVSMGSAPEDLIAAVGPSIGPCCYTVGRELVTAFTDAGHPERSISRWFRESEDRIVLDLWRANADMLVAAGLSRGSVHVSGLCTACHPELFYSYRRDGARAGRLIAIIRPGADRTA